MHLLLCSYVFLYVCLFLCVFAYVLVSVLARCSFLASVVLSLAVFVYLCFSVSVS